MSALALVGPFHFVGIGGAGMSPLAEILRARGEAVSGSDAKGSEVTARLSARGVTVFTGHHARQIGRARTLIWSSAIRPDNPERVEAERRGLRLVHRGDLLEALMASSRIRVAVSGSHGKTTTSAMITGVLKDAGFDPTALVGARVRDAPAGARLGWGSAFVAEADESDRSFLKLHPTHAVVTNADREHLDTYRNLEDVTKAFADFAGAVPSYGSAVLCADDPVTARIAEGLPGRALTYGFTEGAMVRGHLTADAEGFPRVLGTGPAGSFAFTLRVSGDMNALNALGAMAAAQSLGIVPALAARSLAGFRGVARRLEWKGRRDGVDVWDDYGHHPTEIHATLKALRTRCAGRRMVTLFQPHRVTRTRALWNDFTDAFSMSDELWIADIYAAGEQAEEGVTAERLVAAIAARGRSARFAGSLETARETVLKSLREDDVFLTLGAGNVVEVGEAFLDGKERRA